MSLKRALAGAWIAAGLGVAAIGADTGIATADPGCRGPYCGGGHGGGHGGGYGPGGYGGHNGWGGPGPGGHGPGWGPRPVNAFQGFRGAPWGEGPAPWGWGAPPRVGWGGPLPPPGGYWNASPVNYWGYQQVPVWDRGFNQWGIWLFGIWIPL